MIVGLLLMGVCRRLGRVGVDARLIVGEADRSIPTAPMNRSAGEIATI